MTSKFDINRYRPGFILVSLVLASLFVYSFSLTRNYLAENEPASFLPSLNTKPSASFDLTNVTAWELADSTDFNVPQVLDNLDDVYNETLGFQEVTLISLSERTDKRDAFSVQARLSGISYSRVDGVDGTKIPSKALPYTMTMDKGSVGCWRAHLNILQSMVERRVSSALIFEDDADWDVALKKQLVQFARGSRFLSNHPENTVPHSPYGDNWDLLWLGHCAAKTDPSDNRRFVIPRDPTVLPPNHRDEFDKPDMTPFETGPKGDNSTRIMFVPSWGNCATAYAISLAGAEKALYHLSLLPSNDPVDMGYGFMCMFKKSNFNCITPFPTLIGISKPAGPTDRWSDLGHVPGEEHIEEKGHSERVMFSTRQNIDRLLRGDTNFESQYPEVTGPEMSLEVIGSAVGHPEWLEVVAQEEKADSGEKQEEPRPGEISGDTNPIAEPEDEEPEAKPEEPHISEKPIDETPSPQQLSP